MPVSEDHDCPRCDTVNSEFYWVDLARDLGQDPDVYPEDDWVECLQCGTIMPYIDGTPTDKYKFP